MHWIEPRAISFILFRSYDGIFCLMQLQEKMKLFKIEGNFTLEINEILEKIRSKARTPEYIILDID